MAAAQLYRRLEVSLTTIGVGVAGARMLDGAKYIIELSCYRMFMPKRPVSVTLEEENVIWLRGRAASAKRRSFSDALDNVITAARLGGQPGDRRSVVGTVDIAAADPNLDRADAAVRALYDGSEARPSVVIESAPSYGKRTRKHRG